MITRQYVVLIIVMMVGFDRGIMKTSAFSDLHVHKSPGQSAVLKETLAQIMSSNSDASEFKNRLNKIKEEGSLTLWSSTVLEPNQISKADLKILTRTSFLSEDFLAESMRNSLATPPTCPLNVINLTLLSFTVAFTLNTFVFQSFSNIFISSMVLFFMFLLPFFVLSVGVVAPGLIAQIDSQLSYQYSQLFPSSSFKVESEQQKRRRVCIHEAGHLVAGYLCGVPVVAYDVTGTNDAGIAVLADLPKEQNLNSKLDYNTIGGLLVVAMAGVTAESLLLQSSKGGRQDFPVAFQILQKYIFSSKTPKESEMEGYLRWAMSKALVLLRIHRNALEKVAETMDNGTSVAECMAIIEGCHIDGEKA